MSNLILKKQKLISYIFISSITVIISFLIITKSNLEIANSVKKIYTFVNNLELGSEVIKQANDANSIKEEALEIKNELNNGKNSVTIKNEKGHTRYDLDGKNHKNIDTPHKHIYKNNTVKGQVKSISEIGNSPVLMAKSDLNIIRNYLMSIK